MNKALDSMGSRCKLVCAIELAKDNSARELNLVSDRGALLSSGDADIFSALNTMS